MELKFIVKDLDELKETSKEVANVITGLTTPLNILLLRGSMGAGKTTFIKMLCDEMGVLDVVTSPTFALINEYHTEFGDPIYHFDLYRVESPEELFDLGYEEYFYSGDLSLIEWPEMIESLIPYDDKNIKIATLNINHLAKGQREVKFTLD